MAESQGNDAQNGTPGGQYSGPRAIDPVQEHSHDDDPDFITRTRFLSGVAIAGGAVLSAAILVPIVGFAVTDAVKDPKQQWVDLGPVSNFPDGQTTSIAMSGISSWSDARVAEVRALVCGSAITAVGNSGTARTARQFGQTAFFPAIDSGAATL